MTTAAENPRRRPKGDKRARTRARLLDAARELTRQKGYEHTTMADIAERAGMTTGAIYSNYRNRDALFIALAEAYWPAIKPTVVPGSDFSAVLRAIAEATIAAVPARRAAAVGFLTGRAYALGHEDVRSQAQAQTARGYDAGAAWLRTMVADDDLPFPPDVMVRIIHALTEGLVLQRLLTPDLVGDEVIHAALALLAGERRTRADAGTGPG
ncbi:MAG: helix-turn-helix domain-containing protein [Alphaproteobacteria bacterium]